MRNISAVLIGIIVFGGCSKPAENPRPSLEESSARIERHFEALAGKQAPDGKDAAGARLLNIAQISALKAKVREFIVWDPRKGIDWKKSTRDVTLRFALLDVKTRLDDWPQEYDLEGSLALKLGIDEIYWTMSAAPVFVYSSPVFASKREELYVIDKKWERHCEALVRAYSAAAQTNWDESLK